MHLSLLRSCCCSGHRGFMHQIEGLWALGGCTNTAPSVEWERAVRARAGKRADATRRGPGVSKSSEHGPGAVPRPVLHIASSPRYDLISACVPHR